MQISMILLKFSVNYIFIFILILIFIYYVNSLAAFTFIMKRRSLTGSLIGGIKETQEMMNFCGEKNIVCDIELINANQINVAYDRTIKSDVKYRFVIDIATL